MPDSGKIFSWGSNKYGQLACNPEDVPILNHPTEICPSHFNHQKIAEIHSGWSHVVAVTGKLMQLEPYVFTATTSFTDTLNLNSSYVPELIVASCWFE